MKGDPVNLQSRLPTASFAYIPDCQQSDCLQAIIAHIHIAHMTLLRIYTLHIWYYCTHDSTWIDNFPRKARFNTNLCG